MSAMPFSREAGATNHSSTLLAAGSFDGVEGAGFAVTEQLTVRHDDAGRGDRGFELSYAHGVKVVATCRVMTGRVGHHLVVYQAGRTVAVGYPHDRGREV